MSEVDEAAPGADASEAALDAALAGLAAADRLLVACDFDGTLAPITDLPEQTRPDVAACAALAELAGLERTSAAVISGRARAVLRELLGHHAAGIRLVGSHGAELEGDPVLSPSQRRRREALLRSFGSLADRHPGALVEPKPFGVAFHYRRVREDDQDKAAREARAALRSLGVRAQEGHKVVEAVVLEADKGAALEAVRAAEGCDAAFFIGDDLTDEGAFRRLGPGDLGVKVGPGPTQASARVGGQRDVAAVLGRLHELRARHLRTVGASGA